MKKPPKPYRLSGTDLMLMDMYTPSSSDGPGGFKYDAGVLTHLNVPCNLVAMSSFRAFRLGVNAADKYFDLYMPTHAPDHDELVPTMGWRFLDQDGNRYLPTSEAIALDDGRQRISVKMVRS